MNYICDYVHLIRLLLMKTVLGMKIYKKHPRKFCQDSTIYRAKSGGIIVSYPQKVFMSIFKNSYKAEELQKPPTFS